MLFSCSKICTTQLQLFILDISIIQSTAYYWNQENWGGGGGGGNYGLRLHSSSIIIISLNIPSPPFIHLLTIIVEYDHSCSGWWCENVGTGHRCCNSKVLIIFLHSISDDDDWLAHRATLSCCRWNGENLIGQRLEVTCVCRIYIHAVS